MQTHDSPNSGLSNVSYLELKQYKIGVHPPLRTSGKKTEAWYLDARGLQRRSIKPGKRISQLDYKDGRQIPNSPLVSFRMHGANRDLVFIYSVPASSKAINQFRKGAVLSSIRIYPD